METNQTGLNELITSKINEKIATGADNSQKAIEKLYNEGRIAEDFIAPLGIYRNRYQNTDSEKPFISFANNGGLKMKLDKPETPEYTLHQNAVNQTAEKLNVHRAYVNFLAKQNWGIALLAEIFNQHSLHTERQRILIRSVGSEVRGVLSDHYRRLNSVQLVKSFLDTIYEQGGKIADGHMDDTRIFLEAFYPDPVKIPTTKNGDVWFAFGARLSTSDYGDGALDIRSFMVQGVCLNGMVRESLMRQVHLGGRLPDDLSLSQRTYDYDTMTQASAIRDITGKVFAPQYIQRKAIEIQEASGIEVDVTKELKKLQDGKISKDESEEIMKVITNNRPEDGVQGENTLFKLVQSLGAVARDKEPRRKRELEEISGNLLDRIKV